MAKRDERLTPAWAVHPGEILGEELLERGLAHEEFAQLADIQPAILNDFINGERGLDEELALKLESSLGIASDIWLDLQAGYERDRKSIAKAKDSKGRAAIYERACHAV